MQFGAFCDIAGSVRREDRRTACAKIYRRYQGEFCGVERFVPHRALVPTQGHAALGPGHLVHDRPPRALGDFGVGRRQVGASHVQVQGRLAIGLVFCVEKRASLRFFLGAQSRLFAGRGVLAIEHPTAAEQGETQFHFDALNPTGIRTARALTSRGRVSAEYRGILRE